MLAYFCWFWDFFSNFREVVKKKFKYQVLTPLGTKIFKKIMGTKVEYVDSSHLYATNYIRNSKAIAVLWSIFTICYAIISIVAFVTPGKSFFCVYLLLMISFHMFIFFVQIFRMGWRHWFTRHWWETWFMANLSQRRNDW